jgi:DNA modification methylase
MTMNLNFPEMHPIIRILQNRTQDIDIRVGDCRELLKQMPEKSVHCCVTSPPYFGLRDYGHPDQMGAEKTPAEFVESLVGLFREVKRVLRDDGTLWLNLGDSYAGSNRGGAVSDAACEKLKGDPSVPVGKGGKRETWQQMDSCPKIPEGLKPKDLIGIPWRVAFALQADGWYLRQDIIWSKPNPMPESVRDRCTKAHEYIFLLSKSPKYYFDSEAMREPATSTNPKIPWQERTYGTGQGVGELNGEGSYKRGTSRQPCGNPEDGMKNKRSVWTVTTKPFKGAHFATFPPDLIRPCILAGCPAGGTVLDPFGGSGTTGMVAREEGRRAVLLELNPEYAQIARDRTRS